MNKDIPELVETSNNLASVKQKNEKIAVLVSERSMSAEGMEKIHAVIKGDFRKLNFDTKVLANNPVWTPNLDSPILRKTVETYESLFGAKPETKAIHAGLECAAIKEKFPEMDIVSFGPTLKNPHTTDETMYIDTVPKFILLLRALLK